MAVSLEPDILEVQRRVEQVRGVPAVFDVDEVPLSRFKHRQRSCSGQRSAESPAVSGGHILTPLPSVAQVWNGCDVGDLLELRQLDRASCRGTRPERQDQRDRAGRERGTVKRGSFRQGARGRGRGQSARRRSGRGMGATGVRGICGRNAVIRRRLGRHRTTRSSIRRRRLARASRSRPVQRHQPPGLAWAATDRATARR